MSVAAIGMGSNLGDREGYLRQALDLLAASSGVTIDAVSSLYETAPMEIADQPSFLNAVARITTDLTPSALLRRLKEIERAVGRIERMRFGPREVDLDILLFDDLLYDDAVLTIPHPRLAGRAFALVPLHEIAPELVLPGTHSALSELMPQALALGAVHTVRDRNWYTVPR